MTVAHPDTPASDFWVSLRELKIQFNGSLKDLQELILRRVGLVEMFLWNIIIIIKLLVFFLSLLLAYYTTYYNYINYYTIINN